MPAQRPSANRSQRERVPLTEAIDAGRQQRAADESLPSDGPRRRRTPRTPRPAQSDHDTRTARDRRSDRKQQQGINFDLDLLQYARDAVLYMGRRHPEEPGSESIAALVDQAVREKIAAWERKYNSGDALPQL